MLKTQSDALLEKLEAGSAEVQLEIVSGNNKFLATLQWIPEQEWVALQFQPLAQPSAADAATQLTVQELLQEREITYRNLLAAYLKLQEVNRQKTVFLASAAHELKTPLAVIKGYYDLLLTGSLGRLTEKQKDILEESKESCERLVRLVSMFLNYSALESGKLVLQLRENDLRDCLDEMAKRWSEAFQRKGVRLDVNLDPSIPSFRFDYQKVQQAAANLAGQLAEAYARGRDGDAGGKAALLGAARRRSSADARTAEVPFAKAEQRGSQRVGFGIGNRARTSSGNF